MRQLLHPRPRKYNLYHLHSAYQTAVVHILNIVPHALHNLIDDLHRPRFPYFP